MYPVVPQHEHLEAWNFQWWLHHLQRIYINGKP